MSYIADYEVEVLSIQGDRRADLLITSPDGQRWALEIQHTPILYPAIEARTKAYIAARVPVLWVGILSSDMKAGAKPTSDGVVIRKYTIRPWEKWAQALAFKELWYVDPSDGTLWRGEFSEHLIHVEPTSWFESGGRGAIGRGVLATVEALAHFDAARSIWGPPARHRDEMAQGMVLPGLFPASRRDRIPHRCLSAIRS